MKAVSGYAVLVVFIAVFLPSMSFAKPVFGRCALYDLELTLEGGSVVHGYYDVYENSALERLSPETLDEKGLIDRFRGDSGYPRGFQIYKSIETIAYPHREYAAQMDDNEVIDVAKIASAKKNGVKPCSPDEKDFSQYHVIGFHAIARVVTPDSLKLLQRKPLSEARGNPMSFWYRASCYNYNEEISKVALRELCKNADIFKSSDVENFHDRPQDLNMEGLRDLRRKNVVVIIFKNIP